MLYLFLRCIKMKTFSRSDGKSCFGSSKHPRSVGSKYRFWKFSLGDASWKFSKPILWPNTTRMFRAKTAFAVTSRKRFHLKTRQTAKFGKNAKITKSGIDEKRVLLFSIFWAQIGRPVCPINIKLKSQGIFPFRRVMPILAFLRQSPILSNSFARNQFLRTHLENKL